MRIAARVSLVAFLSLVVAATTGLLASNSLPATKLGQQATAVTANGLKPADCASISLTNTVIGSGTVAGSSGKVTAVVNGKPWTKSPRAIPLDPHAVIQLSVGTPAAPFHPMSWTGLQL